MIFKKGDRVTWQSQAGGSTTTKTGVVVGFVRSKEMPIAVAMEKFPDHRRMFDGTIIPGYPSAEKAYLVEVRDGKTDKARPKLYMPWPQHLSLVENE